MIAAGCSLIVQGTVEELAKCKFKGLMRERNSPAAFFFSLAIDDGTTVDSMFGTAELCAALGAGVDDATDFGVDSVAAGLGLSDAES